MPHLDLLANPNLAIVLLTVGFLALLAALARLGELVFGTLGAVLIAAGAAGLAHLPLHLLWLVPLAVLALPHWRLLLGWMAIDALVWVPRMFFYLGPDQKGLPEEWFLGTVVVRDLAVLGLCALVIRQIYRPSKDLVRSTGEDDPAGGVLDRARDARVLPSPRQRKDSRKNAMSSA